jgi:hypothetical protein
MPVCHAKSSGEATLCLLDWESAAKGRHPQSTEPSRPGRIQSPSPSPIFGISSNAPIPSSSSSSRPAFIPPNARSRQPVARPQPKSSSAGVSGASSSSSIDTAPLPQLSVQFSLDICATDPVSSRRSWSWQCLTDVQFTVPAYTARTGRICHPLSFTDLANGLMPPLRPGSSDIDSALHRDIETSIGSTIKNGSSGPAIWDIIICSFALHLVISPSELWERWDMAGWKAAGQGVYAGGQEEDEEVEVGSALEIVRDKCVWRPSSPRLITSINDKISLCNFCDSGADDRVKLRLYRSINIPHD